MTDPAVPLSRAGQDLLRAILMSADSVYRTPERWAQSVADVERDARGGVYMEPKAVPLPRGDRYVVYWPDWTPAKAMDVKRGLESLHPRASFTVLPVDARLERWPERRIRPALLAAARSRVR